MKAILIGCKDLFFFINNYKLYQYMAQPGVEIKTGAGIKWRP